MTAIEQLAHGADGLGASSVNRLTTMAAASAVFATSSWLYWRVRAQPPHPSHITAQSVDRIDGAGDAEENSFTKHEWKNLPAPLTARAAINTIKAPQRCARPPRLDLLILDPPRPLCATTALETTAAVGSSSSSISRDALLKLSFCTQNAALLLPDCDRHGDISPERRRSEWAQLRRVVPCDEDKASQRIRCWLFEQLSHAQRRQAHQATSQQETSQRWCASVRFSDVYRGLVTQLHLHRVSRRLPVLVERAYLEAHTLCLCERRAARNIHKRTLSETEVDEILLRDIVHASGGSVDTLNARRVTHAEFRLMLCYLRDYFTLLTCLYDEVQPTTARGRRSGESNESSDMTEAQWRAAVLPLLRAHGIHVADPSTSLFRTLSFGRGGIVTMDAVCAWAAGQKMWLDGDASAFAK